MNPWVTLAWIVTAGSVCGLAAALGWMWFGPHKRKESARREAGSGFSAARYQVMNRLLSPNDLKFLASQPGYSAAMGNRWKRDSLRIFRSYLRELTQEFRTLHSSARLLVAQSRSDSPELAAVLVRQQISFWRARLLLEGRLLLYSLGIGRVDAAPLVALMEAMRMDLVRFAPQLNPAG